MMRALLFQVGIVTLILMSTVWPQPALGGAINVGGKQEGNVPNSITATKHFNKFSQSSGGLTQLIPSASQENYKVKNKNDDAAITEVIIEDVVSTVDWAVAKMNVKQMLKMKAKLKELKFPKMVIRRWLKIFTDDIEAGPYYFDGDKFETKNGDAAITEVIVKDIDSTVDSTVNDIKINQIIRKLVEWKKLKMEAKKRKMRIKKLLDDIKTDDHDDDVHEVENKKDVDPKANRTARRLYILSAFKELSNLMKSETDTETIRTLTKELVDNIKTQLHFFNVYEVENEEDIDPSEDRTMKKTQLRRFLEVLAKVKNSEVDATKVAILRKEIAKDVMTDMFYYNVLSTLNV